MRKEGFKSGGGAENVHRDRRRKEICFRPNPACKFNQLSRQTARQSLQRALMWWPLVIVCVYRWAFVWYVYDVWCVQVYGMFI